MPRLLALALVALVAYAGAVLALPLPQPRIVAAFAQQDAAFSHCIRLGGRIVGENRCLLGGH